MQRPRRYAPHWSFAPDASHRPRHADSAGSRSHDDCLRVRASETCPRRTRARSAALPMWRPYRDCARCTQGVRARTLRRQPTRASGGRQVRRQHSALPDRKGFQTARRSGLSLDHERAVSSSSTDVVSCIRPLARADPPPQCRARRRDPTAHAGRRQRQAEDRLPVDLRRGR